MFTFWHLTYHIGILETIVSRFSIQGKHFIGHTSGKWDVVSMQAIYILEDTDANHNMYTLVNL